MYPALCDVTSDGDLMKSGDILFNEVIFRLREPLVKEPSLLEKLISWVTGAPAQAQVSIDFPVLWTSTLAEVEEAVTVNGNTNVIGDLSAAATAPLD